MIRLISEIVVIAISILCITSADASDRKGRHRAAEAWSCAGGTCQPAEAAKPAEQPKAAKPESKSLAEQATAGSCANGTCSAATEARGLFRRRR